MEIKYHLTRVSSNSKTGPIPVSTTSRNSCPEACELKGSGCYAESGPLRLHWDAVGANRGYDLDKFCDEISGDWGGQPLEDLKKGWEVAQEKYAFLDGDRACALGASYGGYMTNWIAGNWFNRDGSAPFKCLVTHNGVFDTRSILMASPPVARRLPAGRGAAPRGARARSTQRAR